MVKDADGIYELFGEFERGDFLGKKSRSLGFFSSLNKAKARVREIVNQPVHWRKIDTDDQWYCKTRIQGVTNLWIEYHEVDASWSASALKAAIHPPVLAVPLTDPEIYSGSFIWDGD